MNKLTFYYSPLHKNSRRCKNWLILNNVDFRFIDIRSHKFIATEIKKFLALSDDGFESITNHKLGNMSSNEAIDYLIKNPAKLRNPILVSDKYGKIIFGGIQDNWEVMLNN